jgi:beta-glucosidase
MIAHGPERLMVGRVGLDEKTQILTGRTAWQTWPLPALGVGEIVFSDGPVGVRGTGEDPESTSQCLPSPTALAACWDDELAARVGVWFADQAKVHGVDVVLAPVVNLQRTPIGGRHFECLSEDPLLSGNLAAALIKACQAHGVGMCVKHFVGNEVETDRTWYLSKIDEATLREVYLAPFEQAVRAGVWAVMASYNRTEAGGLAESMVAHHYLLVDILKREWGFPGPVISDWTAVRDTIPPALGGLDLVMPGPVSPWSDGRLTQVVRDGDVPEVVINDKVARLAWLAQMVGKVDRPRQGDPLMAVGQPTSLDHVGATSRRHAADRPVDPGLPRELAARAAVVLTNQDDALPVANPAAVTSVALIGPNATQTRLLGGGSASVTIDHPVSLEEGLRLGFPQATVTVAEAVSTRLNPPELDLARTRRLVDPDSTGDEGQPAADGVGVDRFASSCAQTSPDDQRPSQGVWVEFLDENEQVLNGQWFDQWNGAFGDELPAQCASVHLVADVWLNEPGEHWLGVGTVGRHQVMIDQRVVSQSSHEVGGEVMINSSFNVPPAVGGAVTVQTPRVVRVEAEVQCIPTQWGPRARAGLYHRVPGPSEDQTIAEAVEIACAADLAIIVVGTNEETESEGWDRVDLALPGRQDDLVNAVLDRRRDAIIVVNAGAPVVMPWLDRARTVVWFWFPGQDAGLALADILTGVTEPQGRLPWTLPDAQEHAPVPTGLPDADSVVHYDEGVHVGYRGWARAGRKPARPFGFGLGWSSWTFDSVDVADHTESGVRIIVRATNTGARRASTVAQAYVSAPIRDEAGDPGATDPDRPVIWLGGYARLDAEPGQTVSATIQLPRRVFEVWRLGGDHRLAGWVLPAGTYTIGVGPDAGRMALTLPITWGPVEKFTPVDRFGAPNATPQVSG